MRLYYTRQWLYYHRQRYAARRWLKANGPGPAAMAMFHLNRKAARMRRCATRDNIYMLKRALIKTFYQAGYVDEIDTHRQTLKCWCDGGVWHDGDECYKCGGTGIYLDHRLIRFFITVGGRRYIWHQPENLVTWALPPDLPESRYEPGRTAADLDSLPHDLSVLYVATVREYLTRAGVTGLPKHPPLREALRRDYKYSWLWQKKRRLHWWWDGVQEWWFEWRHRKDGDVLFDESEIPF